MTIKLYDYQRDAVRFVERRNLLAGIFAGMGTGKTLITLSALARARAKRILVVGPPSAATAWQDGVRKVGLNWSVLILNKGSLDKRAARLSQMPLEPNRTRLVFVNYEAYWRYPAETRKIKRSDGVIEAVHKQERGLHKALRLFKPDAIVLDEAHRIKSHVTKQAKFSFELAKLSNIRLALSGTPVMNGIEDLYSIYRFIDPNVFGTSRADFERRYIMRGGYGGYQIVGYRNESQVKKIIARTAYQIDKDDALDLPERVSIVVPVELESKARAAYERMRRDSIVELETTGPDGGPLRGRALATIVLTMLTRLQQIAGGAVPVKVASPTSTVDESRMAVVGSEKLRVAVEKTEDALAAGERVVIFCRFLNEIARLTGAFPHHYMPYESGCLYCNKPERSHLGPLAESYVATISGSVNVDKREAYIKAFHKGTIKVLIVQIRTGSESIDLTAASVVIFYSTDYSLGEFLQARDRIHRHGQKRKVTEYFLQATDSIDEDIFGALLAKQAIARKVTNLNYAKELIAGRPSRKRNSKARTTGQKIHSEPTQISAYRSQS